MTMAPADWQQGVEDAGMRKDNQNEEREEGEEEEEEEEGRSSIGGAPLPP